MSSSPSTDMPTGIKLLAGIAHDLRTPLARLRLRAELECPEEVSRAMEEDFQAVTHLIDQILGYAQGCIAPGGAAGGVALLPELVRRGVSAHQATHPDLILGRVDACGARVPLLPMQRVLANLIGNAVSHGQAPVQVELQAVPDGVEVLVFDAGFGIGPDQLKRALQPFAQLSGAASHRHCGLGLAIVAQLAQQLGGQVVLRPFDGARSGIGIHIPG